MTTLSPVTNPSVFLAWVGERFDPVRISGRVIWRCRRCRQTTSRMTAHAIEQHGDDIEVLR